MSGGHGNHVDNSIWSRAILMGGFILTIGIISFAALVLELQALSTIHMMKQKPLIMMQ